MPVQHLEVHLANIHCADCHLSVRLIISHRFYLRDFSTPPKLQDIVDLSPDELFFRLVDGKLDLYYHSVGPLQSSRLLRALKYIFNGIRRNGFTVLSWEMQEDGRLVSSLPLFDYHTLAPGLVSHVTGYWSKYSEHRQKETHLRNCSYCQGSGSSPEKSLREKPLPPTPEPVSPSQKQGEYRAVFSVTGMTCAACVQSVSEVIESLFKELEILQTAEEPLYSVNLLRHVAVVIIPNKQVINQIVEAVNGAGFDCQLIEVLPVLRSINQKVTAIIGGITCSACVNSVTAAVDVLPFVVDSGVDAITKTGTFIIEPGENPDVNLVKLQGAIEDCGFEFELIKQEDVSTTSSKRSSRSINIGVEGMMCSECPEIIMKYLKSFGEAVIIIDPITLKQPFVKFTYIPDYEHRLNLRRFLADLNHLHPLNSGPGYEVNYNEKAVYTCKIVEKVSIDEHLRKVTKKETWEVVKRLIIAGVLAIPTFIFGILGMSLISKKNSFRKWLEEPLWFGSVSRVMWILFFLSTPVYLFAADVFHRKAFKEIRSLWAHKNTFQKRFLRFGSMNLLMCLGTTVAYVASLVLLGMSSRVDPYSGMGFHTTYFDSVVFLTFFLLIGRVLESISKSKTGDAVASLSLMKASKATVVDRVKQKGDRYTYENDEVIDVALLDSGDYIRISTGESPAMDCVIVEGASEFDESALTGESRSVEHGPGHQIFSGTVNVGNNSIIARILSADGDSLIDQIVNTVRDGQLKKAPIQRVADTITGYFVPVIVLLAILTWIIWISLGYSGALPQSYLDIDVGGWSVWSLEFAIAVFVIACPCGIGLAAPTALFVGSGLAAKNGILAKGGGAAFQDAAAINLVCFDKTGTLTCGKMKATDFSFVTSSVKSHHSRALKTIVLQCVRDLELASQHPIATAVKDFLSTYQVLSGGELGSSKIPLVETVPGKGLKGRIVLSGEEQGPWRKYKPSQAILGNETMLRDFKVTVTRVQQNLLDYWKKNRKSVVSLALQCERIYGDKEFHLAALMACRDEVRPEARAVVEHLKNRGIECWMITGDNKLTAAAIALEVGIRAENVVGEILPHEKKEIVEMLQKKPGLVVAMVGDGINDAPALAVANVGVALSSGADLAVTSSDFILLSKEHPIVTLCTLLDLATVVFRRVKFNFGWSLVYNVLGIPIAAGVIYPIHRLRLSPVWASAAMAASSLSVVTSSLLLGFYRPRIKSEDYVAQDKAEVEVTVYEV